MVERISDISPVLADLVAKRRKEALLKKVSGHQASEKAKAFWNAIGKSLTGLAFDESLPEDERREIWDTVTEGLNRKPSQTHIENTYRSMLELPIPSAARDETVLTDEEGKELMKTVRLARQLVLEHGEREAPDPDGTEDPTLYLDTPEDEKGITYCVMAAHGKDIPFFRVLVSTPTIEISSIVAEFYETGVEHLFDLSIQFNDRQIGDYLTSPMPVREMASNEYKIVRYSLGALLERSGFIPPQDDKGTTII